MQLITPEEIIALAYSPDDPLDPRHIRLTRIEAAQLRYIRPTFGESMYHSMQMGHCDPFVSDYLKPALAHFIRHELIVELAVRASDHGVVRPSGEESRQTTASTRSDNATRNDTATQELLRSVSSKKQTADTTNRTTTDKTSATTDSEENSMRSGKDQRTITATDTDRTTSSGGSTEQTDDALSILLVEQESSENRTLSKNNKDDTIITQEDAKSVSRADTTDGTQEMTGSGSGTVTQTDEQTDQTNRESTQTSTGNSENSGTGNTTRTIRQAATIEEWQLLSRQALRDAHIFLRYAVEYVETHRDQFPEYAPMSGPGSCNARRCIGGIIL